MRREPICSRLISRAEEFYDIPSGSIRDNRRRNGNVSKARWAVSFVLLKEVGWSQPRAGKHLQKDAKAVRYGRDQAERLLRSCPIFYEAVRLLKEEVSPHDDRASV